MTKIEFKNLPDTSTPLNAENLNLLQNNIEDAINLVEGEIPTIDSSASTSSTNPVENQAITNYVDEKSLNIFSTDEQRIGTWIDGKPLYRKVVELTSPSASSTSASTIYTLTIPIREITRIYGCIHYQGITYRDINAYQTSSLFSFVDIIKTGDDTFEIRQCVTGNNYLSKPEKVIFEYTKTTD